MERVPWYVSRRPLAASVRSKEVRIYLSPEHWEIFDRICSRHEKYRGRLASEIVADWCDDQMAVDKVERDPNTGGWIGKHRAIGEQV